MRRIEIYLRDSNDEAKFLYIKKSDNVIAIKRKMNKKIYISPKKLQLSYYNNELIILNNNDYIPDGVSELYYTEVNGNSSDIILLIQRNEFGLPKCIQVSRTDAIETILVLLSNLSDKPNRYLIIDENGNQLSPNKTVEQSNLLDDSIIKIWPENNPYRRLNICDPLKPKSKIEMVFHISDTILLVKQRVSEKMNTGKNMNFVLFSELSYFDDKKLLIDYFIQEKDDIYFVDLVKKDQIVRKKKIKNRKYANLFLGEISLLTSVSSETIALNRYKKSNLNLKYFKYEITTLLMLSNANVSRFITLYSMFEEDDYFYIATEYMEKGSLKSRYNSSGFQEKEIIRYSIQICEALNYMHRHHIIHRNIKCSSVLLDGNNNIKLCNFHLSKYLFNLTQSQLLDGVPGSIIEDDRWWVAPEVLNCEPYGLKADIWAFGATIIEMLTGKQPNFPLNISQAIRQVMTNKTIKYDRNLSRNLNYIIDKCTHPEQCDRITASEAIEQLKAIA